jgi:hypothetical protein
MHPAMPKKMRGDTLLNYLSEWPTPAAIKDEVESKRKD